MCHLACCCDMPRLFFPKVQKKFTGDLIIMVKANEKYPD